MHHLSTRQAITNLLFECLINGPKPKCHSVCSWVRVIKLAGVDVAGPPGSCLHLGGGSDTDLRSLCVCVHLCGGGGGGGGGGGSVNLIWV